jgi:hypothetical protein
MNSILRVMQMEELNEKCGITEIRGLKQTAEVAAEMGRDFDCN